MCASITVLQYHASVGPLMNHPQLLLPAFTFASMPVLAGLMLRFLMHDYKASYVKVMSSFSVLENEPVLGQIRLTVLVLDGD